MARPGRGSADGWFRLGSLDVTTTLLVVFLCIVSLVVFAVEPVTKPIELGLALDANHVGHGQLWRLFTWPVSFPAGIDLFGALNLFFFWYFGSEVERQLGRRKMAAYLGVLATSLGVLWVLVSILFSEPFHFLAGMSQLEILVLLTFIAEYPMRRFFFNIPGWLIAAVIVGLQIISSLGARDWLALLFLLLSLGVAALVARSMGLLGQYRQLPALRLPHRSRGGGRAPRPRRRGSSGPTVVSGPWEGSGGSRDQAALDALLDKISVGGMESLTARERKELMALRERLRRR